MTLFFSVGVYAQDFSSARIESQSLGGGMHVLFAVGDGIIAGNILVSIGEDGVFMVDNQLAELVPKYRQVIRNLGGDEISFAVTTHWHFDHADGNKVLGPDGVQIVAHDHSRRMHMQDNVINLVFQSIDQPRYEQAARPDITFGDEMSFHFNDEQIDLLHFGPAHTMGDSAIIFRDRNIVHLGDVFNNSGFPFIDTDNGGTLSGIINFCKAVLAELPSTAIVVPGHGPVSDYQGLLSYVEMLSEIRDRMSALISSGATLEQVEAAQLTAEWDDAMGDPAMFLNRAFASMAPQ